nr:di-heme oxidoredictase family protein [uncultured Prevotella sp.]
MRHNSYSKFLLAGALLCAFSACSDDNVSPEKPQQPQEPETKYIGQAVGNFSADEWYPGGKLGTTENTAAGGYEDNTPAIDEQGLTDLFNQGDMMASAKYTLSTEPYKGWGPVASRRSCEYCHSGGYAHGHSRNDMEPVKGNGYIVSVYTPDAPGSNNGTPINQLTTFTMLQAVEPFLPPVDPKQIHITWHDVTSMPSGLPMQFPDGEKYNLRYPSVSIPQSAFNTDPVPSNYEVRLIASCNFQGLGLIDAISNEDLEKQYKAEGKYVELNPEFFDNTTKQLKPEAWAEDAFGNKFVKRFNYDLLDGCLENDVALWDELNVLRSDIKHICSTEPWAKAMSENENVISYIQQHGSDPNSYVHPYYNDGTREGIKKAVRYLLSPSDNVNLYNNPYFNFKPEVSDDAYHAFMVWHRGIAVPRARNLNDKDVQRGKELFTGELGCAHCHKASWTTGADNHGSSVILGNKQLPKYANQKIYPYSDFIQHKLDMKNDIHGSWCRTTPLWGRGLSLINSGVEDRLHDARARNEIEAIMWHAYSKNSQAYKAAVQFYNLPKKDRDAVVKFIRSI